MKILHVLDHSLPQQSGYAFRSHSILSQLHKHGVNVSALSGPKHGVSETPSDTFDGVLYERTDIDPARSYSGPKGQIDTITTTRAAIREKLAIAPADVLHAHSPCLNGVAALGHGVPLLYEMRSSWEDAAVSSGTTTEGSLRYKLSRRLETWVVKKAPAVAVICEGLREELLRRGVDGDKIFVMPNALPDAMFDRPDQDQIRAIRERYQLLDKKIIGFFGSFFEWEGVDQLVEVIERVVSQVPEAHLLFAGGGRQEDALKAMVAKLGVDAHVTFAGRIPHTEVPAFYGAADVMAFPRIPHRLTNMVTPLKPLEAMAQGAVVVASDVGGHRELIRDGATGRLFKADSRDGLCDTLVTALTQDAENRELISAAEQYVRTERRWSVISEQYIPVYERLMNARRG
ncbi:MAG: TIGR04063 family PEP-CTERM/XrtA system glycosyltransferase [Woeseiaceae bacterium]